MPVRPTHPPVLSPFPSSSPPLQLAVVSLLTFHAHKRPAAPLPPVARALFWLTCTSSAAVLALSLAHRQRYTAARPYMIGTARVLFSLLCPQLIWQLAGQMQAQQAAAGAPSWPQIFFLWATWSRCGSVLISRERQQPCPAPTQLLYLHLCRPAAGSLCNTPRRPLRTAAQRALRPYAAAAPCRSGVPVALQL